jgi:formamidopyrimidine-DNA glycosylase
MGQLFLTRQPTAKAPIADFAGTWPETLDISCREFKARRKPFRRQIKGTLTRADFAAGIGNNYAHEILWAARLHPYRTRTALRPASTR